MRAIVSFLQKAIRRHFGERHIFLFLSYINLRQRTVSYIKSSLKGASSFLTNSIEILVSFNILSITFDFYYLDFACIKIGFV